MLQWLAHQISTCYNNPPFTANIAAQDYYKKSVEVLRSHPLASDTLGKPIRIPYINLARKDIRLGHDFAQASKSFIIFCSGHLISL